MTLILASASPRRVDLLARLGVVPGAVVPADIDEAPFRSEAPMAYVQRMAAQKAQCVANLHAGSVVLAADTVVAAGRRILPKAMNETQARECLLLLSGRRHRVYCAVALINPAGLLRLRVSTSILTFKRLSAAEIDMYILGGEWMGKAGGYAIQGYAEAFVRHISGSHSGVIGLPLFETKALLDAQGLLRV